MQLFSTARILCGTLLVGGLAAAQGAPPTPGTPSNEEMWKAMRDALPFDIGGGFLLWHYHPFSLDGVKDNTEIYYANLVFDAQYQEGAGEYGIHFEPRFRDSKLRPFFQSNVWIQELYMSWKPDADEAGVLKVGKVYSQFGRFWDGVFYGNIPYFDGLKLDPDLGVSWENQSAMGDATMLDYSVQFFDRDGATNGSLQGRDTLSIARQRDIFVARVAPTFQLGDETSLTAGISGMHFEADLGSPASNSNVTRANGELSLKTGPLEVFGDYTHQNGNHVVDFPLPGSTSGDIDYLMSGASWTWDDFTFRYSYSFGDYADDDVKEDMHLPGVVWQFASNLSLWLEYVYWNRDTAGDDDIADRSLNVILYGSF